MKSQTQGFFLTNQFGDHYLHEVNGGAFNQVGSTCQYQSHYRDELFLNDKFYIVVGTDSGLLPSYILRNRCAANSCYLFIEPAVILEKVKSCLPASANFRYTTAEHWEEIGRQMGLVSYMSFDKVKYIKSMAALDAFFPVYRELSKKIAQMYQQMAAQAKINVSGPILIEQQLKNITDNYLPAAILKNSFPGKTAVVLGGEPSLDDMLPWVMAHREKLLVVAVSRISKRLQQVNVIPDIIVALDPCDKVFESSRDMLRMDPSILFVHASSATALLVSAWGGRHVYLGNRFPWDTPLNCPNIEAVGPTVVHAAVNLLVEMGVGSILLVGVDLCRSQQGYSHAKGSAEYAVGPELGFVGQAVQLNDGSWSEAKFAFYSSLRSLGKQAIDSLGRGCQIVNLSSKAARISSVHYRDPSQLTIEPLNGTFQCVLDEIIQRHSEIEVQFEACFSELKHAEKMLNQLIEIYTGAVDNSQQLETVDAQQDVIIQKIAEAEKNIANEYSDFLAVIELNSYDDLAQGRQKRLSLYGDVEFRRDSYAYLNKYLEGAKILKSAIVMAQQRTTSRIEEEKSSPNFSLILEVWQHDAQWGRAALWKTQHAQVSPTLAASFQEKLNEFSQQFDFQLRGKGFPVPEKVPCDQQLKNIESKLRDFFLQKNSPGIRQILLGLSHFSHPQKPHLQSLAEGYLAELNKNLIQAAEKYSEAAHGLTLEFALNSLASVLLAQQDKDRALLAFARLSELAPGYLPQYAESSALAGQQEKAVTLYEQYLMQVPDDFSVLLKLGLLYKKMEKFDCAREVLQKVVERHPENPSLASLL